jgi:hypothetical protein
LVGIVSSFNGLTQEPKTNYLDSEIRSLIVSPLIKEFSGGWNRNVATHAIAGIFMRYEERKAGPGRDVFYNRRDETVTPACELFRTGLAAIPFTRANQ